MKLRYFILSSLPIFIVACNKQLTDSGPSATPGLLGQMTAVKNTRTILSGNDTFVTQSELAFANFYQTAGVPSSFINAGIVSVNDMPLNKATDNSYSLTSPSLSYVEKTLWNAANAGDGKPLVFNDTTAFPFFSGALPYTVNRSTGLSIFFAAADFLNADSVRIYVSDGTGNNFVQRIFSTKDTSINFSSVELSPLQATMETEGVIAVIPFQGKLSVFQNRAYFFQKESRYIQSVRIN